MTLQLLEGFDHYSSAALAGAKGWSTNSSAASPIVAGRITGNAFSIVQGGGTEGNLLKSLPAAQASGVAGFAFKSSVSASSQASVLSLMRLRAGASNVFLVEISGSDKLIVKNSAATVIATGTTTILANTWYYVELKFVVGTSGTCEVKLNGAAEIATTTGNFGTTNPDLIGFFKQSGPSSATNYQYDDIYVLDLAGSLNNTFLGDMHVYTLYPSADGNYSQWTPDSGSPHFSRVNEHTSGTYPDGDTSYVTDATSGHRDSYAFDDLIPLTGTVFGVQPVTYARKDDAGLRQFKTFTRESGTDYDSSVTQTLATSYAFYTDIREVDPATSAAWAISAVNGAEFGIKVV